MGLVITDPLLDDKQVSELTGISVGTLRWWRHDGTHGPRWFKLGPRAVRYRTSDVEAWISERYAQAGA